MPLRKKHVRFILAGVLTAAVLVPLAALVLYGFRMSGDAMARDLAARLESRLHAGAQVTGVRPTGPCSATIDRVELTWAAAGGRLVLVLEDLTAERNASVGPFAQPAGA
jgi:hypothetical protein